MPSVVFWRSESVTHFVLAEIAYPSLRRAVRCLKVNLERGTLLDFRPSADRVWDTFLDTQVDPGRKLNDSGIKMVGAVGIEQPGAHPIQTILERFRGHVSMRTRPKNTNKTRCRTFL
jgi:hypothetical protein